MGKRRQLSMAKAFNTTGAPTKGVPVVGSGGTPPTEAGGGYTNYLQVVDVRGFAQIAVEIGVAGGTTATATIQATNDPLGLTGWTSIAYREIGGGAYATTALTLVPAGPMRSIFLDPADTPSWLRLNITVNTGSVALTADAIGDI